MSCIIHIFRLVAPRNPDVIAVITVGEGKFYCNGLDLPWLARLAQSDPRHGIDFRDNYMQKLLSKLLTFPVPTIAVLNGEYAVVAERLILSLFSVVTAQAVQCTALKSSTACSCCDVTVHAQVTRSLAALCCRRCTTTSS